MNTVSIQDARKFNLKQPERQPLLRAPDLHVELLCFEGGQTLADQTPTSTTSYQVLEGELMIRAQGATQRLGKGKLLQASAGETHTLENTGGGLLVVLATRSG
jgi:quercetin dioxygenase-like cupin family protein